MPHRRAPAIGRVGVGILPDSYRSLHGARCFAIQNTVRLPAVAWGGGRGVAQPTQFKNKNKIKNNYLPGNAKRRRLSCFPCPGRKNKREPQHRCSSFSTRGVAVVAVVAVAVSSRSSNRA